MDTHRESISTDHMPKTLEHGKEFISKMGQSLCIISTVWIVAPLLCHYTRTSMFAMSSQLVGNIMGIIVAIIGRYQEPDLISKEICNPYNILTVYYSLMICRFVYGLHWHVFIKSLPQILIITILGWTAFGICFSFLLVSFAGGLKSLTFSKLALVGVLFTPTEMPNVLLDIPDIKQLEIVMTTEGILSSILSVVALNMLLGGMSDTFSMWYQPVCVLLRLVLIAMIIGVFFGLLAGHLISKYASNGVSTMLFIITSNFLLYHLAQFVFCCSGGLCCFLYVILICRKRVKMAPQVDKDVMMLIDLLYDLLSTVISFMVVCDTLPLFVGNYSVMSTAISLALYICANACRFVFFVSISPLLSRLGYGYSFKPLVTMVWCIKKGPMPFILLSIVINEGYDEIVPRDMLHLGLNFMFLTNALNEISSFTLLRKLNFTGEDLFKARNNIQMAYKSMEEARSNHLALTKLNRFYVDANWNIIKNFTTLGNTNATNTADESNFNELLFDIQQPYCTNCRLEISYEPSKKEYQEMIRWVHLRIVQTARVSFVRQFKNGFLNILEHRTLYLMLDRAMLEPDYNINFDNLMALLREKQHSKYYERLRRMLFKDDKAALHARYIPRFPSIHRAMTSWVFIWCFHFLAVIHYVSLMLRLYLYRNTSFIYFYSIHVLLMLPFLLEFMLKVIGCTSINRSDGFRRYIKLFWNKVDFILLIHNLVEICTYCLVLWIISNFHLQLQRSVIGLYLEINNFLYIARILRFFRLIRHLQIKILTNYDARIDMKLQHAYSVGRAVVVCFEEVGELLHTWTDQQTIVKDVRNKLQMDRNGIAKELGLIEMRRSKVITELKTHQAMICTITTMSDAVRLLRSEGMMDEYEFMYLNNVIAERWKAIIRKTDIPGTSPKMMFCKTTWLGNDEKIIDFLYDNVKLKVWDAGEVVYNEGDVANGIYIIVTGMFKVCYNPMQKYLRSFHNDGLLPIKDLIRNSLFEFPVEEFIFKGNSIGELSVLTGRSYCCDVYAEIPTQAFIITKEVLQEAMQMNSDPIKGLYSRIWIHITRNLVHYLLKDQMKQAGYSCENINSMIGRSFVPKMDAYDLFHTNEAIENIVLIEGVAVDFLTKDKFVAPCLLPRGIVSLVLCEIATEQNLKMRPKLWIIPVAGLNCYEIMMFSEITSDLNDDADSSCYLWRDPTYRKWWQKDRHDSLFLSMDRTHFALSRGSSRSGHNTIVLSDAIMEEMAELQSTRSNVAKRSKRKRKTRKNLNI